MPKKRDSKIPRAVTIFGGGVSGLTVAHELVERGFQVEVWECAKDERVPSRGCAVGGMARTQWAAIPWPPEAKESAEQVNWKQARAHRIDPIDVEFYVINGALRSSLSLTGLDQAKAREALLRRLGNVPESSSPGEIHAECVHITGRKELENASDRQQSNDIAAGHERFAAEVLDKIFETLGAWRKKVKQKLLYGTDDDVYPTGTEMAVRFRRSERWLPGEHGYRFFPSFYSHVFETMQRTPLLEPRPKSPLSREQERAVGVPADEYYYTETGKTAFENLISAEAHALAFEDDYAPLGFPRYLPGSLSAVLREWRVAMDRFNFAPRDLARYGLRLQEYALASGARRKQLSTISWWQFIGGDRPGYYTKDFKYHLSRWSEGLVAMDAQACDARTYGTIVLQLIFDQYRSKRNYRDGILNGPTSDAWLEPWRRYLEAQGVRFIHGRLVGFEFVADPPKPGSHNPEADGRKLWPIVECYEPRYPGAIELRPKLLDGYFVMALPLKEASKIAHDLFPQPELGKPGDAAGKRAEEVGSRDLKLLAATYHRLSGGNAEVGLKAELDQPRPRGTLRHFAGLQFYFREDLSWVHGHIYYPDAAWGLSSISQARFWQDKHDWEHGYRGLMSVIIGAWDVRSPATKKTAWESAPHELAEEVWRQLKKALQGRNDPCLAETDGDEMLKIPDPIFWRLDSNLTWNGARYDNSSPFQINLPGEWGARPGDLDEDDRTEEPRKEHSYSVYRNVVLAGTYMKTHTRVCSMEAANESGRHAANAILKDLMSLTGADGNPTRYQSKLCKIYPVEHRESKDLDLFRCIDEQLVKLDGATEPPGSLVEKFGLDNWTAFLPRERR